jgi:hypothetical protein
LSLKHEKLINQQSPSSTKSIRVMQRKSLELTSEHEIEMTVKSELRMPVASLE